MCICLEHDHIPLGLSRGLLGSSLEPKLIQGCMRSELAYIIEGYWRTRYLFLFVIGFDPSNIHVLLYVSQEYGNSSIFPNLVNWIGYFVQILIDLVNPKTSTFSTQALIWVHFKTVHYFFQPIFSLFSYSKNALHNLVIELCSAPFFFQKYCTGIY